MDFERSHRLARVELFRLRTQRESNTYGMCEYGMDMISHTACEGDGHKPRAVRLWEGCESCEGWVPTTGKSTSLRDSGTLK